MFKWIHHLFNPHCPDCMIEKECKTCDTLRNLLEIEKFEKKQLLDSILEASKPVQEIRSESKPELVRPNPMPWRVRQQMLENEDREKARILNAKQKEMTSIPKTEVEDLEKELDFKVGE